MENGYFRKSMCIFACLLNARKQRRNILLVMKIKRKNILQDFQTNIFKEILKQNSELVENSTLLTY